MTRFRRLAARCRGLLWRLGRRLALWRGRRFSKAPNAHEVWLRNRGRL